MSFRSLFATRPLILVSPKNSTELPLYSSFEISDFAAGASFDLAASALYLLIWMIVALALTTFSVRTFQTRIWRRSLVCQFSYWVFSRDGSGMNSISANLGY